MTIYQQVEHRIMALIDSGVLRNGEKIPSLRMLSEQLKVSVNTVREAYERLENRHYIEAVPQSGYYVRSVGTPSSKRKDLALRELDPREMSFFQVYDAMKRAEGSSELVQLGAGLLGGSTDYWVGKHNHCIFPSVSISSWPRLSRSRSASQLFLSSDLRNF